MSDYGTSPQVDESIIPPCDGLGWMFDSRELGDHIIARGYCKRCPLIDECHQRFQEALQDSVGYGRHAGPEGTWAGVLYNAQSERVHVRVGTCKDCKKPMLPGGSNRPEGYVRHQRKGRCESCDSQLYKRKAKGA